MSQTHSKFKIFTGRLSADHTLGALAAEVEDFVRREGVAAKSIGAEFLEHADRLLLTLGYRDDEPGAPVRLRAVSIGALGPELDFQGLEASMGAAAAAERDIICHELYVTAQKEIFMIFLTLEGQAAS
jgi:hypothetical protein